MCLFANTELHIFLYSSSEGPPGEPGEQGQPGMQGEMVSIQTITF